MVKEFFGLFNFEKIFQDDDGNTEWKLETDIYENKNHVIKVTE